MNKVFRTLAAAGAVAAVPLGLAAPAQASPQNNDFGWVKVCQKIYHYDPSYDYWGDYSVDDSYHNSWDVQLGGGSYDCYQTKVHTGWVNVYVNDFPYHADFDSHQYDSYQFRVKRGYTYVVTFRYHDSSYSQQHARAAA
jgi:hypothetical protein